jgi:hypothetical protein
MPTTTHTAPDADFRGDCVVSVRHDAYWVAIFDDDSIEKHDLTTGGVTVFDISATMISMVITADQAFLVGCGYGYPITVVNAQTGAIVGTNSRNGDVVAMCDDGTIISARDATGGFLAHFSIDENGALTELSSAQTGNIAVCACAPGSTFAVAAHGNTLYSYKLSPTVAVTPTDAKTSTQFGPSSTIAINPANSNVFFYQADGSVTAYHFDSTTGMFGSQIKSLPAVGDVSSGGVREIHFAYGKLFFTSLTTMHVYDNQLNHISSHTIAQRRGGVCVSQGIIARICFLAFAFISHKSIRSLKTRRPKRLAFSQTKRRARMQCLSP